MISCGIEKAGDSSPASSSKHVCCSATVGCGSAVGSCLSSSDCGSCPVSCRSALSSRSLPLPAGCCSSAVPTPSGLSLSVPLSRPRLLSSVLSGLPSAPVPLAALRSDGGSVLLLSAGSDTSRTGNFSDKFDRGKRNSHGVLQDCPARSDPEEDNRPVCCI